MPSFAADRPTLRLGAAWVAVGLAALALGGCSKRITSVDSSFQVEGQPSPSQLVVFRDMPSVAFLYRDTLEAGPSPGDYIIDTPSFYEFGPNAVQGMIFDYTQAGDFQIFRQESNGGFLSLKDFPVRDSKQWVDSHSELFRFVDETPLPGAAGSYLGRGIIGGAVSSNSPLTNLAAATQASVGSIDYTGDRAPEDSLFTIEWTPVAGAAGYWLQVYQFRSDLRTLQDRIVSGAPAPIFAGKSTDWFVGFMPAGVTSYKLGDPVPAGGRVLFRRQTLFNFFYFVRVSAVGPSGDLIAYTGINGDYLVQQFADQTYLVYPLGAVQVAPVRPENPSPARSLQSGVSAPADWAARHPASRWIPADALVSAPGR